MNIFDARMAVSGGVLHHIGLMLAAEEHRCSWCDAEQMRLPRPAGRIESNGICPRHLEQMRQELQNIETRRMAA